VGQEGRSDDAWDREARDESPLERLDRNWGDLLQELRVVQTGVQLLTGFLLTLPFQQRFTSLAPWQRDAYLVAVGLSVGATALLVAPVALHRLLFREHRRGEVVAAAHRYALAGLAALALSVVVIVLLIGSVVAGTAAGAVLAAAALVVFAVLWLAVPLAVRRGPARDGSSRGSRGSRGGGEG
jgi:hypothetical protein